MRHPALNMGRYQDEDEYKIAMAEWEQMPNTKEKIRAEAQYRAVIAEQMEEYRKMKENEKQFAQGVKITKKDSKYGTFYKVGINVNDFCDKNPMNERGWVNFDIFESKEGKPYAVIDTYGTDNNNIVKIAEVAEDEIPF